MAHSGNSKAPIVIGSIIALGVIAFAAFQFQAVDKPVSEGTLAVEPVIETVLNEAPPIPEAEIPQAPPTPEQELVQGETEPADAVLPALPSLDESDDFIREHALELSSKSSLAKWLATEDIIRRAVTYVDGVSRGVMLSNVFPMSAPKGNFATHNGDEKIWLNAGNYERYKRTVSVLTSLEMENLAALFHLARPLLISAFSELGYNTRQMDGIILQAIDVLLETPIILEPIELTQEAVVYKFADPELEALLPIQKLLLRTGPENTRKIQKQLKILKKSLLNPQ